MVTFTNDRLHQVIGRISGSELGFKQGVDGKIEKLPDNQQEVVDITKIFPTLRMVEFYFRKSELNDPEGLGPYYAQSMIDNWHKEGLDKLTEPKIPDLSVPSGNNRQWPFSAPKADGLDLQSFLMLLVLSGAPFAQFLPGLISASGGLDILTRIISQTGIKTILELLNTCKFKVETLTPIAKLKDGELMGGKDFIVPKESLHGVIVPLNGDKGNGFLLVGFTKLEGD